MREIVISLIAGVSAAGLIDWLLPDGESGSAKYMRYIISLVLTLTLLAPIKLLTSISLPDRIDLPLSSVEASLGVNSIGAMRIRSSVAARFGYSEDEIKANLDGRELTLTLPRRLGVVASDLVDYVAAGWGVDCEVIFIE